MQAREALQTYTGKKHVYYMPRCNAAIKEALSYYHNKGYTKVLIQDEGGWMTYKTYPKQLGMQVVEIMTRNSLLDLAALKEHLGPKSVLLINSMPSYSILERMDLIVPVCERYGTPVINDVSGSIGTPQARYGNLIVGSFGVWKPIWLGIGGFIASNDTLPIHETPLDEVALAKAIKTRADRTQFWQESVARIKKDLSEYKVLHPEFNGFVVIVKYKSEEQKHHLIEYCAKQGWAHTLCPRYIRVNEPAISIEVKRNDPAKTNKITR